jgi:Mce-associated membrane protein
MTDNPKQASASRLLAGALALFVVALACAAWFGWSWHSADGATPAGPGRQRDAALAAGEQAVQNFNTLDYRHVNQGIRLWLQSSAGALHAQVQRSQSSFAKQVEQARTVTTARVLDGALTALSTRNGTATVIVALQITVTPASGTPVTKRSRLLGQLTRTAGGWRLTQIGQVPVSGTGSSS